jgi:oligopeptide transport system substrate-binding protein
MAKAKEEMAKAENPNKDITFFFNNAPGHKEIAVAVQAQWKELGIHTTLKQQEWAQFLDFIGPPPNSAVDIFRYGWIYDIPDAINGLEIFTCDSGNNSTNWCNKKFDSLYAQARQTPDDNQRYKIYRQMEQVLYGPNGDVPAAPIYWYTNTTLRKPDLQNFSVSPQTFIDFTKIKVSGD